MDCEAESMQLPRYYGCGSIKRNREIFLKRKEKKRKRRDFLTY